MLSVHANPKGFIASFNSGNSQIMTWSSSVPAASRRPFNPNARHETGSIESSRTTFFHVSVERIVTPDRGLATANARPYLDQLPMPRVVFPVPVGSAIVARQSSVLKTR
jgi:hypothetical protein